MPARVKITDRMVDAAFAEIARHAAFDGASLPSETENPKEWAKARAMVKDMLVAAASVAIEAR